MKLTILRIQDVDIIDECPKEILAGLRTITGENYTAVFESDFGTRSGYVETLEDETDLIIQSNPARARIKDPHLLLEVIGLDDQCSRLLCAFSRGYQKYIALSLQLNVIPEDHSVCILNLSQYLDDNLIRRVIAIAARLRISHSCLAEYDVALIRRILRGAEFLNLIAIDHRSARIREIWYDNSNDANARG